VQQARIRRARLLVPIDEVGPPTGAEWALAAALHDIVQSTNPGFDNGLRRKSAARILDLAETTIERVGAPANALDALSRHTWFARALDITRTDTVVSWWTGSRTFLGEEPPDRLRAWPRLRRVEVARSPRTLLKLAPLATGIEPLMRAVAGLLTRTPLTELATCTRAAPPFVWSPASAGLVTTAAGRALVLRALARLAAPDVDAALGRATRLVLEEKPELARAALALLAERVVAQVSGHVASPRSTWEAVDADAAFARSLGAAAAARALASSDSRWRDDDRRRLLEALEPIAGDAETAVARLQQSV
jgi:hypothetical protein